MPKQNQKSLNCKLIAAFLIATNLLFFIPLNCFAGFLNFQTAKSHSCCAQQSECHKECCNIESKSAQDQQLPIQKAVIKTFNQKLIICLHNDPQLTSHNPNILNFRYDQHFLNFLTEDHLFLYFCSFLN